MLRGDQIAAIGFFSISSNEIKPKLLPFPFERACVDDKS